MQCNLFCHLSRKDYFIIGTVFPKKKKKKYFLRKRRKTKNCFRAGPTEGKDTSDDKNEYNLLQVTRFPIFFRKQQKTVSTKLGECNLWQSETPIIFFLVFLMFSIYIFFSNILEGNNGYSNTRGFRRGQVGVVMFFILEVINSQIRNVMLIYLYIYM